MQPLVERVMAGEEIFMRDMAFTMSRNGRRERTWFTFSMSPVRDATQRIVGMYGASTETTHRMRAERRQAFQLQVADTLRRLSNPHDVMAAASRLLGEQFGVGRVGYAVVDESKRTVSVDADWTDGQMASLGGVTRPMDSFGPELVQQAQRGVTLCIDDISRDTQAAAYEAGYAAIGVRAMIIVPLLEHDRLEAILYLHEASAREWSTEEVELAEDVARRTWDAFQRARAEQALLAETRVLELLQHTGARVASTLDMQTLLQAITDTATELSGAQFGAFFYNAQNADGDVYRLYTLSGAPWEAFEGLGHPRATPVFGPTFHGQPPIRSGDITRDPRYGQWPPHHGMPPGHLPVRSYLAVPVVSRSGETIGGLFLGHADTDVFTERTERLIGGIAAQAALAIDNARLYAAAQKAAEEREALLVRERLARAESERLSKMKDQFLAMLAHELRNPLAPIATAAELLNIAGGSEAVVQRTSEIILRQTAHMTRMVNDLLDVSRVTRDLVTLEKRPLNLKEVIATAVDQVRPLLIEKKHQLTLQLPDEPLVVNGDVIRLVQALANILHNAAKYTPDGGEIWLSAEIAADRIFLSVKDNGVGMPTEFLPQAFELFSQGAQTLARSQGGLGLGLALVKKLVELHGGAVNAFSEGPGKGSTFGIALPRLRDATAAGDQPAAAHQLPIEQGIASVALPILVVDDNRDAALTLAEILQHEGYAVSVAHSAEDALLEVSKEPPAVMLLDIGLPGMDGYDLARQIKAIPELRNAILIATTGYGQGPDLEEAMGAGFHHHFVKPVDLAQLCVLLARIGRTWTLRHSSAMPESKRR
ncbi:hybrid sensor histidine kinase/response regulator [Oxalobacteraceae bacterium OM1]|nr:hybrid sensor histidine kinase/response regulator [Oxalobacteraceae bacterium OM1]